VRQQLRAGIGAKSGEVAAARVLAKLPPREHQVAVALIIGIDANACAYVSNARQSRDVEASGMT
jgi:hypothetical protein